MGTSSLPSLVSSPPLPLLSPLDDWFASTISDLLSSQALTRDPSTGSPSSSSSSSSLGPAERRSFLHRNPLDGFHPPAHAAFSQVVSPVISNTSASKENPDSHNSSCISAMSYSPIPNADATQSSAPQHFQALESGSFNQFANTISKPREENTPSCISSIFSSADAASIALSSAGSTGAGVTKVSKRRARINKKAPIAVLSADTSNFRAMVQQLTGIPPSHAPPPHIWASSGSPLLRPQPTRFVYNGGLPTLDTSASLLGPKQVFPSSQRAQQPLINGILSGGASNHVAELAPFQSRGNMVYYDALLSSSLSSLWDAMGSGIPNHNHMKGNVKELLASNLGGEAQQTFPRQASNLFESLLMSDDDLLANLSYNAVDSWLAFDGGVLSNHSPKVDLAKIAS